MNQNSALPYWLTFAVVVAALYGGWKWWQVENVRPAGGIEVAGPPLDEFTLTTSDGQEFHSEAMHGKVWVATFFFATCAGSCPRLNASIQHLNALEELHDVTWVSITVDPSTDTPELLQEYAQRYNADPDRWMFLRGEMPYIKRVGRDILKLDVTWRGHKDHAIVIDRAGKIRGMYDATSLSQTKKLQELLIECLAEDAPTGDAPANANQTAAL